MMVPRWPVLMTAGDLPVWTGGDTDIRTYLLTLAYYRRPLSVTPSRTSTTIDRLSISPGLLVCNCLWGTTIRKLIVSH